MIAKTEIEELKVGMADWIKATSAHSISVEAEDRPMTEAEEARGEELADEAESLEERAKGLGTDKGTATAQAFHVIRDTWLRTGMPPAAIQKTCALAARIGA
jgi:hypothetical protein